MEKKRPRKLKGKSVAMKNLLLFFLAGMIAGNEEKNVKRCSEKPSQILAETGDDHNRLASQDTSAFINGKDQPNEEETDIPWPYYKEKYNKDYGFVDNLRRKYTFYIRRYQIREQIRRYREGEDTYFSQVNEFTDWFSDELEQLGGVNEWVSPERICNGSLYKVPPHLNLPKSFSWRDKEQVSEVMHQGQCAADYAFSAVGALESHIAIKKGSYLRPLSVQNVLDCSTKFGNNGCFGGMPSHVYDFLATRYRINSIKSYPYVGQFQRCQHDHSLFVTRDKCRGCQLVPPGDETALKAALVLEGPISVSMAVHEEFYSYKSGIYSFPGCENHHLNHAMLLVGYGTDNSTGLDYWLVKNSWGKAWGENGYVRTLRNKNNHCGIASMAIFPIV